MGNLRIASMAWPMNSAMTTATTHDTSQGMARPKMK
jgi:hypothetical protein